MKHIVTATALILTATVSNAATLTATSTSSDVSGFWIEFADNGDGLLQFTEVTSFGGMTEFGPNITYSHLTSVPTISGISDYAGGSGGQDCGSLCGTVWAFSKDDDGTFDRSLPSSLWTYEFTDTAIVPLPATLPLILAGLGGLGLLARHKRIR